MTLNPMRFKARPGVAPRMSTIPELLRKTEAERAQFKKPVNEQLGTHIFWLHAENCKCYGVLHLAHAGDSSSKDATKGGCDSVQKDQA